MVGSWKVRSPLRGLVVVLSLLCVLAVPATALATPPNITDFYFDPMGPLPYEGGTIEVHAQIASDAEPVVADAVITGPTTYTVRLSTSPGGDTSGLVNIPGNPTREPVSWRVDVRATDENGESSTQTVGSIGVDPDPVDDPPAVSDASVSPSNVPSGGGTVTLSARASDRYGITEANAVVTRPDGTDETVPLTNAGGDLYTAQYSVPANTGTTGQSYLVNFVFEDDAGQESSLAYGFGVDAPPATTGKLKVSVGSLHFGDVRVGRIATRWFYVTNTGASSTQPLTATLTSSHARFSVAGASTITVAPGETKAVPVVFRPTSEGVRTGRISVKRADGKQSTLGVDVDGRGVR
jgi:hypothetical protein